jgi:hypothetical protein
MAELPPALPTIARGTLRLHAMVAADAAKEFPIFSSPKVTRY